MKKKIFFFLIFVFGWSALHATVTSSVTDPAGFVFNDTVFAPGGTTPTLFLASLKNPKENINNLSSFSLATSVTGTAMAQIQPLAGGIPMINGEVPEGLTMSPLKGTIDQLGLFAQTFPLVSLVDPVKKEAMIYLVADLVAGASLLSNTSAINDAGGNGIDKSIVGLAASDKYIFAAVPQMGKIFSADDGPDRGIAVLEKLADTPGLRVDDASNVNVMSPKAVRLEVTAAVGQQVSFFDKVDQPDVITKAEIGDASLWWDDSLQRLYIGLSRAERDVDTKAGGIWGVSMGYFDKNSNDEAGGAFTLAPIVNTPKKALFYDGTDPAKINVNDRMIGFFYDGTTKKPAAANNGDDEVSVAINFVRTMNTSTDKHYLIVSSFIPSSAPFAAGGIIFAAAGDQEGIYALPLIADEINEEPDTKGVIAKVGLDGLPVFDVATKQYTVPTLFADMPTTALGSVKVGGGKFSTQDLQDLFVAGDSVYVALNGLGQESRGIFQSTAIFDKTGFIKSWTQPKRVMGSDVKVFGAGLDTKKGNFYFLSNQDDTASKPVANTGQITQWGDDDQKSLTSVLSSIFPQASGGVHQIFSFDAQTPGFTLGKLTMLVAVGLDTVALIESGNAQAGTFTPTAQFSSVQGDPNQNVFVFSNDVLKAIGPLTSAEIALDNTVAPAPKINVYVGGYGGIALVQLDPMKGVPAAATLSDLQPAIVQAAITAGGFQKIAPDISSPVVKIDRGKIGDQKMYVLTPNKAYVRDLAGAAKGVAPFVVTRGSDLVVNDMGVVIATGSGLVKTAGDFTGSMPVVGGTGPALQLQYFGAGLNGGIPTAPGTLYALMLNGNTTNAQIWRFAVDDAGEVVALDKFADAAKTPRLFLDLNQLRTNFATDGTMLFNEFSKDSANFDFVLTTSISSASSPAMLADQQSLTSDLGFDLSQNFNVGVIIRDDASGAWLVPGDWGVKVNE